MSPQQTIAHYRILSKLGEGGMGEVWRATDTKLNRDVAIKLLPDAFAADPDRLARFTREAQVLASLNHPNIAAIYGVEDRALVIELVDGPTLAERIAQGAIPLDEALPIARQIADALQAAHEKGIVHRDLKPANIKLTADGRVKVLDFGLAKAMAGEPVSGEPVNSPTLTMRATVAGVILGTAAYMAPEQARGKAVDQRADIWAFGVVLYEMVTGHTLFAGETVSDTLAAVLTAAPDCDRVPPPLRRLVRSCLEREPQRRLRDIGDAWRLLDDAPAATPTPAAPARPLPWMVAAGVLALALAALAALHFREEPALSPLVRFSVPAPPDNSWGSWLALSPDGRQLAFTASSTDGTPRVWLRSLDSLEIRPLAHSEGANVSGIFWSSDSRFLVFQADGKVKRVEIAGGPPQSLCDSPTVLLGGSWRPDGVILFGNNSGPLMRVSSAGGTATPVTRVEPSRGEIYHSDPIFLPDGRHFLYFRHASNPANQGVYAGAVDARPEEQNLRRIQAVDFSPAWVPSQTGGSSGYLLFLRDQSLVAQPFNPARLETTGEAVPVVEGVGTYLTRALFSVSPAGVLAWRGGGGANLQFTWYDRQGRVLGHPGEPGDYQDVALSPDGSRLAYNRPTQAALRQIWILDLAHGIQTRFTFETQGARSAVWSPDGRYLAYSSLGGQIYIKETGSGGNSELAYGGPVSVVDDWSRDGRFLLFNHQPSGSFDIAALTNPAGGERKTIPVANSPFTESNAQVSPDSHWVAYSSNESGRSEIYVRPFPPGGGREGKWLVSSTGGFQPRWRGDGKEVYYLDLNHALMAVDVSSGAAFQSTTPHALFRAPGIGGNTLLMQYDVTRDGKRFVLIAPPDGAQAAPATVVLNWQAGLKK